jgi:hypothetical protein
VEEKERLTIVLKHLIEHNVGHSEDYRRWIDLARSNGMDEVAGLIEEANGYVGKAGAALEKALTLVG